MSRVAIVGIGCRYAGGIDSPESFWNFVVNKGDGVVDIPAERWDYRRYYDPDKRAAERMYTKRAAFLHSDPWQFDPDFFGISPREGATLDPQQRMIMEVAWEALDDAGVAGRVSGEAVGVYVGAFTTDHVINAVSGAALAHVNMHSAASASFTMLSNRLAYALNLKGPALTVDTACSSSLVAFHLGTQAIINGDCDMALVGGVNMMLQPETFVTMCKGGFLATDGRCKSFSASADGYGRGEGAGMVLLRRLEDAVRDGDRIYAVVEATGSNQDGRTTAITVPSLDSQEALARSVCERSGIAAHEVTYVEAHGTGTPVGDPVELRALGRVYGAVDGRTERLPVGSVKSTIGHTEAAAGVASVIKGALAVYHRTLPPQGWFEDPNPDIPFDELRVAIQLEAQEVGADVERMAVAINGFGYGGTNAHAILAEPQQISQTLLPLAPKKLDLNVFPVSARSEAAARELAGAYADLLDSATNHDHLLTAVWTRRAHHRYRVGIPFANTVDLTEQLRKVSAGAAPVGTVVGRCAGSVFVFSGMGPQWWAMGRDLLNAGGAFATEAARIDAVFKGIAGWSIIEELLRSEEESRIASTEIAQPANFLVQVALTRELAQHGITPDIVVGHSVGEVSAAYVSGMLSLRDALVVSHHRGRLQATTAGTGGMLAIGLPVDDVRPLLAEYSEIDIAAINSPSSITVAGDPSELEALGETLSERGVFARMLRVEVPYHSRRMDPILDELRSVLADIAPQQPSIPLYSTVTGEAAANWDADYWCDNVRQPVRFADAVKTLIRAGHRIFIEVGPHPVLSANIREALLADGESGTTVSTLDRKRPDAESVRQTIAGLYAAGALKLSEIFAKPAGHLALPRYPWQRQRLHQELPEHTQAKYGSREGYSMLGDPDLYDRLAWQLKVSGQTLPWLADHVVNGACLIPGAAYLDAALSAAAMRTGSPSVTAEDVRFVAPLIVDPADGTLMRTEFDEPSRRFTIRSRAAANTAWTVHATGRLVDGTYLVTKHPVPDTREMTEILPAALYAVLGTRGLTTGPNFQRIRALHASATEAVATVDARPDSEVTRHLAHPCVIDAALQVVAPLIDQAVGRTHGTVVPVAVEAVRAFGPFSDDVTVIARRHANDPMCADIVVLDADQSACLQLVGVHFASITPGRGPLDHMEPLFYEEVWDLREDLSPDVLVPADQTATMVVAIGDRPHRRARELAEGLPNAFYYDCTTEADPQDPEIDVFAELPQHLSKISADLPRLHVCVVAGEIDDDVSALWSLQRVATATERFLDEQDGEGTDKKSVFGDGSVGDDTFYVSLVTERAFAHSTDLSRPNPSHAGLAGARRVLVGEQPRLRWRLVDVEPETQLGDVMTELSVPGAFCNDNADEVLLRSGLRFTPVITRTLPQRLEAMAKTEALGDREANFTVEVPKSRILSELGWRRCARPAPGRSQVELQMQVVGLNYKDAIKVLGLLGERDLVPTHFGTELGMEGVGVVTRVGSDVTELKVGDVVITAAKGMLTRYHLAEAVLCGKLLPTGDGDFRAEHCTSITAFLTAERSLLTLARLEPGETVLIHGAAGGVGSAAIQVAKARGANVIGTARTDERRAYALAAGADHVIDSRSLNFVDDVREITEGRGADVIISSAPGEILRHNFEAVAEFGRIIEVGKADIYQGGTLDLAAFDKNVGYFSIDMDRMLAHNSAGFVDLITTICEKFSNGTYQPLPVEVFGTAALAQACEEVFRSERTGRVAVRLTDDAPPVKPSWQEVVTHPDAAYLITGGYGGFGLATGRWLVRRGARHLILVGRSGATTEIARKQLEQWRTAGIEITEELLDVTDQSAVTALVRRSHTAERPLRGIFHTAGAVADQRVADLELDSLRRVYDAKVEGARALWAAVAEVGVALDQFAFYSSGGSMLGTMGQYSYTSANLALQSLTEEIVRGGQAAICIGWGHMSGLAGGMASDETAARYLNAAGFDPIDMDDGPIYLEAALRLGITQAAIIPINWSKVNATVGHLRQLLRTSALVSAAAEANSSGERLRSALVALDEGKRGEVVAYMLAEQLAGVMGVSPESIEIDIPVTELGLDSLMAVEFGARASQALGVHLATLQMGRTFDLRQAGSHIAEVITTGTGAAA